VIERIDMSPELDGALETCRKIHKRYGTSYYFATRLFPRDIRLATHALYAFFRLPDEIVDGEDEAIKAERLEKWIDAWHRAYSSGQSNHPVLQAALWVFQRFHIPFRYSEAFLFAMKQDLSKSRYATYVELQEYMYGSAAVVGLMMTHVIGFEDERALQHAEILGYAMQLTNFLRDIHEDYVERGRIYLPQDELVRFHLTDEDIMTGCVDERYRAFMQFQIARTDSLYEQANQGIVLLDRRGRVGVRAGSDLYRLILRKIEAQDYDVFRTRARTSLVEKMWCVLTKSLL